jgi:hypothetical protein
MQAKDKSFSDICAVMSVHLLMLLAFAAFETNASATDNEYWISTNTDSGNLGTLADPFICNTQPTFDLTMNNFPDNSVIHLLPGTYQTEGSAGWFVKPGQKILGSGLDVTIIQLVQGAPSGAFVIISYPGTNIVVSDLTVDGNYTSGAYTYCGVELTGTKLTVSRVKAINLAFFDPSVNSEAWGIGFDAYGYGSAIQNSDGNLIEDCEVSHFQGGSAITAISFNGGPTNRISGIMRGNRVYLPTGEPITYKAFNGSYAHDWLVEDNYVHGGGAGFYGDTGSYSNVVVAHNLFENCYFGAALLGGNRINLKFEFNTILLNTATNEFNYSAAFFFCTASGFAYTNVTITGNSVDFSASTVPGMSYYFLHADTVGGLTAAHDTVNSSFIDQFIGCSAVNLYNNVDLNGNTLTNETF